MTIVKETTDLCNVDKVQPGSVWTRHDSGEVVQIGHDGRIEVRNNKNDKWWLDRGLVSSQFRFADQCESEVKITRTEMIGILKDNRNTAMTVVFHKKLDEKKAAKELAAGQGGLSDRAWLKKVRDLTSGEERTMVGHHYGVMDDFDRLQFKEHGKGNRLVDTRTIKELVVNQVHYKLKK